MLAAVALLVQTDLGFEFGSRRWGGGGEGYELEIDREVAREGSASGRIRFTGTEPTGGAWTQCFEADDYRGTRLRLTGYVRTADVTQGWAGLWMRVDGPSGSLAFDNMAGRGVSGTSDWTRCRITLDVPEEAEQICLGMLLAGNGTAWVDEISLEAVPPPPPDPYADSAEDLDERGRSNLIALARAWGLIRFFHPEANSDLDEALVAAIPAVERAGDLEVALRDFVAPLRGTVLVNGGQEPHTPRDPEIHEVEGGTIVDLRGAREDPPWNVAMGLERPIRIPDVRRVRHIGYAQGEHGIYRTLHLTESGRTIEPERGSLPRRLMLLVDRWTSPRLGGIVIALAASGHARVVGEPFAPLPEDRWETEIAPGVRLAIPLAVYVEPLRIDYPCPSSEAMETATALLRDDREPERAIGPPDPAEPPHRGVRMRQVRLADVILLWNILRHFYPYWDVVETDWDAALGTFLARAATDAEPSRFADTMNELLALAQDGHGWLTVQGAAVPVAAPDLALAWVEDRVVIAAVGEGSAGAGFEAGMEVVEIDGRPAWLPLDEAMRRESGATPQFRRFRALSRLLAGARDSEVELAVRHPGGETRRLRARRDLGAEMPSDLPPHGVHETVDGDILYINLSEIDDEGFRALLDEAVAAAGVIFDLRGYPGNVSTLPIRHLIDREVRSPHMDVPIITHPDRSTLRWTAGGWPVAPEEPRIPGPVVFLTDGRAISYAETYLAVIQNSRIATILGEPTAGTNGNVTSASLPGGVTFSFTGMRVTNLDGSRHHGVGVPPDVEVHRTVAGVREGRDEFVEAAVRVIRGRRR